MLQGAIVVFVLVFQSAEVLEAGEKALQFGVLGLDRHLVCAVKVGSRLFRLQAQVQIAQIHKRHKLLLVAPRLTSHFDCPLKGLQGLRVARLSAIDQTRVVEGCRARAPPSRSLSARHLVVGVHSSFIEGKRFCIVPLDVVCESGVVIEERDVNLSLNLLANTQRFLKPCAGCLKVSCLNLKLAIAVSQPALALGSVQCVAFARLAENRSLASV